MAAHRGRRYRRYDCQVNVDAGNKRFRWHCVALFAVILAGALSYVWLRSEQERLGRDIQGQRSKFAVRTKELVNLRMEMEGYKSGKYILTAVDRLGLELRAPLPGQVRRVKVERMSPPPKWLSVGLVASGPADSQDTM